MTTTETTEINTGHGSHRELVGYAADALITRRHPATNVPEILMVKRGHFPFVGSWAFPGGYVDGDETAEQAAAREAMEETHVPISTKDLKWIGLYDAPDRDPRGRVVGTAWWIHLIGEDALVEPVADDDAAAAEWVDIEALLTGKLGPIAFDHADVIRDLLADPLAKYLIPVKL